MEVRLPVGISEVGITDGTSAVQHFVIAHINAAVGNACDILAHRAVKEHDVSRLCLFLWHIAAQATQPLGSKASGIVDTAVGKHIADKTRAVEGRFRGGSAPDIGVANVLGRFFHERGKAGIGIQGLLRDVVEHGVFEGNSVRVAGEYTLHIAVRGHVQRITSSWAPSPSQTAQRSPSF